MSTPRAAWRAFWRRAPRQLVFTRSGKVITGIAVAVGFAAINTGNNLLFLGWGLTLAAIIVSGVLSESALRDVTLELIPGRHARAGVPARLDVTLRNGSSWVPSFGLDVRLELSGPSGETHVTHAPYLLRLSPNERRRLAAHLTVPTRGRYAVSLCQVGTSYPFGFFFKTRRYVLESSPTLRVAPPKVPVDALANDLLGRMGEKPAGRSGRGDEYFGLRPYRPGDDPRRVAWRRSLRSRTWMVVEHELWRGETWLLELWLGPGLRGAAAEHAVAVLGSLAELLLDRDMAIGVRAPGLLLPAGWGEAHRLTMLDALADVTLGAPLPTAPPGIERIAIEAGARADDGVAMRLGVRESRSVAGAA